MNTENRDNLIRILGNLIADSKQTVDLYWNGPSKDFHKAIEALRETVQELERTYVE